MNSKKRRILPDEWESRKNDILELSRENTIKDVLAIMKKEHNFDASLAQYESQLRLWGFRKHLSMDEWTNIVKIVDKLESQGKKFRVSAFGKKVGNAKIVRARRICKEHKNSKSTLQGRSTGLRHASIEIEGTHGKWIAYTDPENAVNHAQNQTTDHFAVPAVDSTAINASLNDGQDSQCQAYDSTGVFGIAMPYGMGFPPLLNISDFAGCQYHYDRPFQEELGFNGPEALELNLLMETSQLSPQVELPTLLGNESSLFVSPWVEFPTSQFSSLSPACDIRFDVAAIPLQQLMKSLGLLTNNPMHMFFKGDCSSAISRPIEVFREDVFSSISREHPTQIHKISLDVNDLLSSLQLLPYAELQRGYGSGNGSMMENQMLQTNLVAALISSTIDGFTALGDIPIQSVLKYLKRFMDIRLLSNLCYSHIGKAFAENLFRAAIEARDKSALKCLLGMSSIGINTIVCTYMGRKYTPIERAVCLLDLDMVNIFLKAKAAVNETCGRSKSGQGILGLLLNTIPRNERASTKVIDIGKLLLEAGAKVHLDLIGRTLQSYNMPELAFALISRVSETEHSNLICEGFLSLIAVHLDDEQATQATKNIIMACEWTGCRKCKIEYAKELDWALVQGAKKGHLGLVKSFLLHSKTPHRALSGAIRSGKSEVVEAICTLKPDINASEHSIDDEDWTPEDSEFSEGLTTSYAEAIEAQNENLLLEMESTGALKLLKQGGRFEPAITAACKIGKMEYVEKFLKCYPNPNPFHMSSALFYAVQEGNEEILQALLAAGAEVDMLRIPRRARRVEHSNYFPPPPPRPPFRVRRSNIHRAPPPLLPDSLEPDALFTAVLRQHPSIVRSILNTTMNPQSRWKTYLYKGVETTIIGEALRRGNEVIVEDLLSTHPDFTIRYGELLPVLEAENKTLFESLLSRGAVSVSAITRCLEFGLSRGDTKMIEELVEMGADPIDPKILRICAEKYPAMLHLLCKHVPYRNRHRVVPGFGTYALYLTIGFGQPGLAAVRVLLDTGLIDAKSFVGSSTPLGEAIYVSRKGQHANFEVIRRLLDSGCDPNSTVARENLRPNQRQTALLEAIDTGSVELVRLLIDRGANINKETGLGLKRTPLQKAVELEHLEIVSLLLDLGANINAKAADRGGATAFQLAAIQGNRVIATKLLEKGADPLALPSGFNGRWPLEGAAEYGHILMIYFLWEVNKCCFEPDVCRKAMELAKENGFMACSGAIEELLQKKQEEEASPALDFSGFL